MNDVLRVAASAVLIKTPAMDKGMGGHPATTDRHIQGNRNGMEYGQRVYDSMMIMCAFVVMIHINKTMY